MESVISQTKQKMEKVMEVVGADMATIRVGGASPQMVQDIEVEVYEGQKMKILEVASITAPDHSQIIITPWDKSVLKGIEKGILESDLGLNPNVTGEMIRIVVPTLTEERRRDYVKLVAQKLESGKVMLRSVRQAGRESIDEVKDSEGTSEDDVYRLQKELDDLTGEYSDKLEAMAGRKETEVMRV